eukprot:4594750-Pleurochrysis_carterae.AAC.3
MPLCFPYGKPVRLTFILTNASLLSLPAFFQHPQLCYYIRMGASLFPPKGKAAPPMKDSQKQFSRAISIIIWESILNPRSS